MIEHQTVTQIKKMNFWVLVLLVGFISQCTHTKNIISPTEKFTLQFTDSNPVQYYSGDYTNSSHQIGEIIVLDKGGGGQIYNWNTYGFRWDKYLHINWSVENDSLLLVSQNPEDTFVKINGEEKQLDAFKGIIMNDGSLKKFSGFLISSDKFKPMREVPICMINMVQFNKNSCNDWQKGRSQALQSWNKSDFY